MDRRVLFASLILLAGGATGVGVALFAFVGVDDATIDAEVVWESRPSPPARRRQRCGRRHHGRGLARHPVDGRGRESNDTRHRRGRRRGVEDGCRRERYCRRRHRSPDDERASRRQLGGGDEVVAFTTESGSLIVLNPADGTERRLAVDLGGPGGLRPAIGDLDGDGDAGSPRSRPTDESEPSTPPARRCSRQTSTRR